MEGFLLTRLGASLVYRLAAWQGYLGTSVGLLFDLFWEPGLFCERPRQGGLGTCVGLLFDLACERGEAGKGFLLTCLGASLVYPLAAWQGYLGTSVGFLFDLFWVPGLFCERP